MRRQRTRYFKAAPPLDDDPSTGQVREARARASMRPIPLSSLLSTACSLRSAYSRMAERQEDAIMSDLHRDLAQMTPDAKLVVAKKSGYNVHQDQPEVVIARDTSSGRCRARSKDLESRIADSG